MENYEAQLRAIAPELSFGYQTIRIGRPEELQSLQVGYSVGMEGQSLLRLRLMDLAKRFPPSLGLLAAENLLWPWRTIPLRNRKKMPRYRKYDFITLK
jgi:hypothetical protein